MFNWNFLNQHRVREPSRTVPPDYCSDDSFGFTDMFRLPIDGKTIRCLASDGLGWKHVSVSIEYDRKPPSWSIMCKVKDLFWDDECWVVQFHPPKSEYVNFMENCLHLWEYTGGGEFKQPTPHHKLVGPKGSGLNVGHRFTLARPH